MTRTADLLPIPNFGAPRQQAPQAAAASVSSPGRAAAVTNTAPEVMALTAPGMARDTDGIAVSTAERAFGPGDILAKLETELAGFVAELNARDRLMRRHRLDYDDPPPLFLSERRDDPVHGHGQMPRSGKRPTPLQVLRALSERVLSPAHGERLS